MKLICQCLFSPRLYKIYSDGVMDSTYQANALEKWGDRVINAANTIFHVGMYSTPIICIYIYKRGFYSWEESRSLARFFSGVGFLIVFSLLMRGIGRATNQKYTAFMKTLNIPPSDQKSYIDNIRKYDFDFHAWPVSYAVAPNDRSSWLSSPFKQCANPELPGYQRTLLQILAFATTHTFGLRIIYPGCLGIINKILWHTLLQGRTNLITSFDGKRAKVTTADGNFIDTMFVDNRHSAKGKTLVICSEGNSGFYEIGIMGTPVKSGYSALGWNHPGFAGSSGYPYPQQEQNAIDAVMQYAINDLQFQPENIVMFGWSIGGYTSTWASVQYPVKALILDATFDDLLPLAQNQMPSSWSLLVKEVVRSYVNLNISDMLTEYNGPVLLIRRTQDEIISLRQGVLSTNRGNFLVQRLIETRHPEVIGFSNNTQYGPLDKLIALSDSQRATLERGNISEEYRKCLTLIRRYMHDYKSTHCAPLPEQVFDHVMDVVSVQK